MGALGDLTARLRIDTSEMGRAKGEASEFGAHLNETFKGIAEVAAAAFAFEGIKSFIGDSLKAATNAQALGEKMKVVFGDSTEEVKKFGENAAQAYGMSAEQADGAAAKFGNFLQGLGYSGPVLAEMSTKLVGVTGDLAAFNNVPVEEVQKAISQAEMGRTKGLKALGVDISATDIQQRAMTDGLGQHGKHLTDAEKAQVMYELILEKTGKTAGFAAAHANDAAESQRRFTAQIENAKEKFGLFLLQGIQPVEAFLADHLPAAIEIVSKKFEDIRVAMQPVADFMQANLVPVLSTVGAIVAVLVSSVVLPALVGAIVSIGTALASPIVLIAALVAALVFAYQKFPAFREAVQTAIHFAVHNILVPAFEVAKKAFEFLMPIVEKVAGFLIQKFGEFWEYIKVIWPRIQDVISIAITIIKTVIEVAVGLMLVTWHYFGDTIMTYISVVWEFVKQAVSLAINVVKDVIQIGLDLITGHWGDAWHHILQLLGDVWDGVTKLIGIAITGMLKIFASLLGDILQALGDIAGGLWKFFTEAMTSAAKAIGEGVVNVVKWFADLPGKIIGAFGDVGHMLWDVGTNIVMGLVHGLEGAWHFVTDKLTNLASNLPGPLKAVLGIGSPSRVMAEQIGVPIAEGIAMGIDQAAGAPHRSLSSMMSGLAGAANGALTLSPQLALAGSGAASGGGGGGGAVITNHFTISGLPESIVAQVERAIAQSNDDLLREIAAR